MEDGFQILLYVAAFVVWIISSIQKNKKPKRKVTPVPPVAQEQSVQSYEEIPKNQVVRPEKETVSEYKMRKQRQTGSFSKTSRQRGKQETFFGENPYRDSVEYRKRQQKKPDKKELIVAKKESELEVSEIDWKKAVIFSEILRPRF